LAKESRTKTVFLPLTILLNIPHKCQTKRGKVDDERKY
jgi:hypothetical protein